MRGWPRRRRAEEFARRLDGAPLEHRRGADVSGLATVARGLRSVPVGATADPDFRRSLRERLIAEAGSDGGAQQVAVPAARQSPWTAWLAGIRAQRGLALTTVVLTIVVAVAGLWAGTNRSLPGDALYGLKLRAESTQLALAGSTEQRGRDHLAFASQRLSEVSGLLQRNRSMGRHGVVGRPNAASASDPRLVHLIRQTLGAMDRQTHAGARALHTAYATGRDPTPLTFLDDFTRTQQTALAGVLPALPPPTRGRAQRSMTLVKHIAARANGLLDNRCGAAGGCGSPSRGDHVPSVRVTSPQPAKATPAAAPRPKTTERGKHNAGVSRSARTHPTSEQPSRASGRPATTIAPSGPCLAGLCHPQAPSHRQGDRHAGQGSSPATSKPAPHVSISIRLGGIGINVDTCRLLHSC